jgi:hypothetical protein
VDSTVPPGSDHSIPAPTAAGGQKVPSRWVRLSFLAILTFSVYGVFAFLVVIGLLAWLAYRDGHFSPSDTAFLGAESTLLLAAAAILVIVFEIEKVRKQRSRRSRRRTPPPKE